MPDVVLGSPEGKGDRAGSLHVVSLGRGGEIVLAFDGIVDGDGPDLRGQSGGIHDGIDRVASALERRRALHRFAQLT